MARTKAEIRAFLDGQVGKIAPHPGYPSLNGQCVTLTKALMEFLGVPNPYAARGDAINAGDTYIRQGLGTEGRGWLTIVVNRDMGFIDGVHYGHIWIDLLNEANYEANGARALYTTKNTRPISQGQQFINFDKWVTEGSTNMYSKANIEPKLVAEHYSNYTNGHTSVKPTDAACQGRFEIVGGDADSAFWRGLNNHQLDIIKGLDAQVADLTRKLANAGAGANLEPAAEVNGKVTLWKEKA